LGLGLNIVVGFAGLLDLGFVAFYAVGAYGYALGYEYLGIGFLGAIPMAAVTAGIFGAILGFPVLRMHGDYLAIVTLGFGEIIRLVLTNWVEFTGGPNGIKAPYINFFGVEFTRRPKYGGTPFHEIVGIEYDSIYRYVVLYSLLLFFVVLMTYAVNKVKNISIGRAWEALREDEIACRSLGINHVVVKLSAFSMGASIGGISGAFFAAYQGFINPTSFTFFESALILAIVVLGGLGSIPGVIFAAIVLTVMPEMLREVGEYRVLMFGILMVVMMILKPRGLLVTRRPDYSDESLKKNTT
jgi:branched-chain amino acid transport system permease protein